MLKKIIKIKMNANIIRCLALYEKLCSEYTAKRRRTSSSRVGEKLKLHSRRNEGRNQLNLPSSVPGFLADILTRSCVLKKKYTGD